MKGIWKNSEVKELFGVVEDYKDKNKSLKLAFIAHAEKYGRKPNSVRNYYYHEVDNLKTDEKRLEKLGINLSLHNKNNVAYFSKEEENQLMKEIDEMVRRGVSVRKACLTLSNGDISQMLRFQNKYRNFIAKNQKNSKINNNFANKEIVPDNVIEFKKIGKRLTDLEVQSLFMGLVRLVKRNALEESEDFYKSKLTEANENLRKAIARLSSSQRDKDKMQEELSKLRSENSRLLSMNLQLKCNKADVLRRKLQETKK